MSAIIYTGLAWLPRAPVDFAAQCRHLPTYNLGVNLQRLAQHALDENQLTRLAKVIDEARRSARSLMPLTTFRLGIISNATADFIVAPLVATAARYGIVLECVQGEFDNAIQDALDADSAINRAGCDAVLIAIDYRGLPIRETPGDMALTDETIRAAVERIEIICGGLAANSNVPCIIQTLARPPESLFGSLDRKIPGTLRYVIEELNQRISNLAREHYLVDVAAMAETVGLANWHDPTLWNMARVPFAHEFLPLYADYVCRVVAAVRGKARRCLMLDLDNTLWGGVIGDDGLEGIRIAQGDPTGEAYLSVQRAALSLRERGVVLGVSSKNDDVIARRPFREHPEMVLREHHLAVFQANWDDKASNIKAAAADLALGLESLVFLDDNPAERALIRQKLPQVAVPELPDNPALYARTLLAAGYFESVVFSTEDRQRAQLYEDNARRVSLKEKVADIETFLASLNMEISFAPFDSVGRTRIAQLIAKSNQFNLTTRRYSEAEVAAIQRDPSCFTLQVRLADVFGDNGMISVIIARREGSDLNIDTWLMSCRVLGRRVEHAVLREIVEHAQHHGLGRIIGTYRPTERNGLVKNHYAGLGFALLSEAADGTSTWALDPSSDLLWPTISMTVRRYEQA
jgi:FkbH-like protein